MDTVGRNKKKIAEYIRNQLREDHVADQLTLFEEIDPFTGEKIVRSTKSFFEKQRVNVVQEGTDSVSLLDLGR